MIRSVITATAAIAASACMLAAATPAFAAQPAMRMTHDARGDRFCTVPERITGSLIPVSECHDAAGWARRGLGVRIEPRVAAR